MGSYPRSLNLLIPKCVCLAKKSVNRKPFLERTIFFNDQNFFNCHQGTNMSSSKRFEGLQFSPLSFLMR